MRPFMASFVLAGAVGLGAVSPLGQIVAADTATPVHLRGEVQSVNGQSFQLASPGGAVAVDWNDQTRISSLEPAQVKDITFGMFVGTAAVPQPDGTLKALEVHIFPESMRGSGEGYRPFPQVPQGTMTNATVSNIVGTEGAVSDNGLTLTLTYKDGQKTVSVPKGTPVVEIGPGDASMIQPHAKVSVTGTKDSSGKLTASRIQVGLDGVTPPL